MIPTGFNDLAWKIVRLVHENKGSSAGAIDRRLMTSYGIEESKATVYRRIADLRKSGILICHKRKLALNPLWVDQVLNFSTRIKDGSEDLQPVLDLPMSQGESRTYRAASLYEIDPIWNSIILQIAKIENDKTLYGYNARAWYPLLMPESEKALYDSLARHGISTQLLLGGQKSWLVYAREKLATPNLNIRAGQSLGPGGELFMWCSRNFVIECRLPAGASKELLSVFDRECEMKQENFASSWEFFRRKAACNLVVTRSAKRAQSMAWYFS